MRKLLWLVVLTLAAVAGCSSAPTPYPSLLAGTIIVGVHDDQPGFAEGDLKPAGFDIDVMNAVGAALDRPVTHTPLTSPDRQGKLKNHEVNLVIATYSITQDRNDKGIDFAGPYLVNKEALLVRAADPPITAPRDMTGKSVCTVKTTTNELVRIPGVNTRTVEESTGGCVALLKGGGTDAVLSDLLILYGYVQANPGSFRIVLPGVFGEAQYYGIGLLAGHHSDCVTLNKVITDYLRTQWRQDFQAAFPAATAAFPGSDPPVETSRACSNQLSMICNACHANSEIDTDPTRSRRPFSNCPQWTVDIEPFPVSEGRCL